MVLRRGELTVVGHLSVQSEMNGACHNKQIAITFLIETGTVDEACLDAGLERFIINSPCNLCLGGGEE